MYCPAERLSFEPFSGSKISPSSTLVLGQSRKEKRSGDVGNAEKYEGQGRIGLGFCHPALNGTMGQAREISGKKIGRKWRSVFSPAVALIFRRLVSRAEFCIPGTIWFRGELTRNESVGKLENVTPLFSCRWGNESCWKMRTWRGIMLMKRSDVTNESSN